MMKKIILIVLSCGLFLGVFAKNEKGIIYFKNGTSIEASFKKLPIINEYETTYYDNNNKKYKSEWNSIDSIRVWNPKFGKEKSYLMIQTAYYEYINKEGETKELSDTWLIKMRTTETIIHYMSAFEVEIDDTGTLKMKTAKNFPKIHYAIMNFFQRPGEKYPTLIAPENKRGANWTRADLKLYGGLYFKECPALVELISSKEFDINKIYSIVDLYPQYCK